MPMTTFNARRIWSQPMEVTLARQRFRILSVEGVVNLRFIVRLFDPRGRSQDIEGTPRASSSTFTATPPVITLVGAGGFNMQAWWTMHYDLNIGGMQRLSRIPGARDFAGFRLTGANNYIQCFDLVPGERRGTPHTATFTSIRGDSRPRGAAPWDWEQSHDRTIRDTRTGPNIVTTTEAGLPVRYSGSLSAEVSATVGAEMGWELGPSITGGASAGAAAGASVDLSFGRRFDLRLIARVAVSAQR